MKYLIVCLVLLAPSLAQANKVDEITNAVRKQCVGINLGQPSLVNTKCEIALSYLEFLGTTEGHPVLLIIAGTVRIEHNDFRGAVRVLELVLPMLPESQAKQDIRAKVKKLKAVVLSQRIIGKGRRLLNDLDEWLDK